MKVLIAARSYPPYTIGGGEVSTQNLAEGLAKSGLDVIVVSAGPNFSCESLQGVRVLRIPSPNLYWSYQAAEQSKLRRLMWHTVESLGRGIAEQLGPILTSEQPDVFHTSTIEDITPYSWQLAHVHEIPVVHTLRSYTLLCPHGSMFRAGANCEQQCLHCSLFAGPKKRQSRFVDHVIGNSDFILDRHLDLGFFPNAATSVVHNIFDRTKSDSNPSQPMTNTAIRFGYIGRLTPVKGIEVLLEAFKKIPDSIDATLTIAGKGDPAYEAHLRRAATGLNVRFLGQTTTSTFFDMVDVTIVPSLWHEPLARTIFEAYAYGVPVIASDTGGSAEILANGETGYLYPSTDSHRLLEHLMAFAHDPMLRERMRPQCLVEARKYSTQKISKTYATIYEAVLKARS